MMISGFTMCKNVSKLYYPIKASIESILPIVDEFVVALGDCDDDDNTEEIIRSINSDKIKIIPTKWDLEKYPNGTENAHQTDIAKEACTGDWLFYLQADEVVHEDYLDHIVSACRRYYKDYRVDGFLFKYKHFWGDYNHYQVAHGWYPKEIRIVRNDPSIHSWESAQSFRRIPNFDYKNYRQQAGTHKLRVIPLEAEVYHYGWVRPPSFMQRKRKALDTIHQDADTVNQKFELEPPVFDYGPMNKAVEFKGSHPSVMKEWIAQFDWANQLRESGPFPTDRELHKHERLKYRILTFFEQRLLNGNHIGGFKNYIIVKDH